MAKKKRWYYKMKKKWYNGNPFINAITKTGRFKILLCLLVALAIFAAFNFDKNDRNIFSGMIYCHTNIVFILMFYAFFLLATLNTCISFYRYDYYLIRLKNKRNVIKKLISLVLQINGILLFIYFIIYLCFNNIAMIDCYEIKPVFSYGINTNSYAIYIMMKFYLFAILFMIINTILFVIVKEGKTAMISVFYLLGFFIIPQPTTGKFSILPWNYYYLLDYKTFKKEVIYFILYLILCIILINILVRIGTKQKRGEAYDN